MNISLKLLVIGAVLSSLLTGCGWLDRLAATVAGDATEICVDGVAYLQFTSGASVKYTREGKVATCNK